MGRGVRISVALALMLVLTACDSAQDPAPVTPASLIYPEDLDYLGAFRLPDGEDFDVRTWAWADGSITYCASGDPDGPTDGFEGSLFGIGHAQHFYVSEIDIPQPVVSATKNVGDLPTATTLQGFADIFGPFIEGMEIPVGDIEYLGLQEYQDFPGLHMSFGQWLQYEPAPSRAWSGLHLSALETTGAWYLDDLDVRGTADYLFAIPQKWAAAYTGGRILATGRYKDGGQASQGPTLFAYSPRESGHTPEDGAAIPATTLLRYDIVDSGGATLQGYEHSDEWLAGTWLTAEERSAVVFAGTKGIDDARETWYGFADGGDAYATPPTNLPDNEKGWWSDRFEGQILFYDPADLAAVAVGDAAASDPQPYAVMNVDEYLFHVMHAQQKRHVVGAAFDGTDQRLYLVEPFADGDKPIIHVWGVE